MNEDHKYDINEIDQNTIDYQKLKYIILTNKSNNINIEATFNLLGNDLIKQCIENPLYTKKLISMFNDFVEKFDNEKRAFETLGNELFDECIKNMQYIDKAVETFYDFSKRFLSDKEKIDEATKLMNKIPDYRWKKRFRLYAEGYSGNNADIVNILQAFYLLKNDSLVDYKIPKTINEDSLKVFFDFLIWCNYSFENEIKIFFSSMKRIPMEILKLKMKGESFKDISDKFLVSRNRKIFSRNRVVQIYDLIIYNSKQIMNDKFIRLLFADIEGKNYLTYSDIKNLFKESYEEVWFLLKQLDISDFTYHKENDHFYFLPQNTITPILLLSLRVPALVKKEDFIANVNNIVPERLDEELISDIVSFNLSSYDGYYFKRKIKMFDKIKLIMALYFENGFDLSSKCEVERFVKLYSDIYESNITYSAIKRMLKAGDNLG